jgi:hypothetical protein
MFDVILADRFYQDDADKIKLNWLCYEYANNLYAAIREDARLPKAIKGLAEPEMANFCVYFAKRMRKSVYDKLTGTASAIAFRTSYVREFYPSMAVKHMDAFLRVAIAAWNQQLLGCGVCPNQCLEAGFDLTDMFDSLAQTGWPER